MLHSSGATAMLKSSRLLPIEVFAYRQRPKTRGQTSTKQIRLEKAHASTQQNIVLTNQAIRVMNLAPL